ncbi:MBL fold metallo-hydrolase [Chitinophaga rhizophila]|uniref:MBL fold metallo-hydrolase n=1 Tax=Chitinophaga rhizophila TaxID=2866212 RepID=A0ABS7GC04_9BACT|nr:MBL fold metallo-hydrolase [Chitinophaga rhizophila]MBW8684665.1 MBL fold metallo-hydrolase [Chitinophaga rhizophila]
MQQQLYYLRPNVVMEPLVDNWYAWSHLISPATAAMNIVGRHMTIMESYMMAPNIHAEAILNPNLRGGPFMDIPVERAGEVKALYQQTVEKQAPLIELSKAIKELDKILAAEAKGFRMEPLYEKVPDILKGYVELYYDRHNHPGFRFFESLLYNSPYYNKDSQSVALWVTDNDHRPFVLSTPRIGEENVLQLQVPFDHPGLDELAKMKRTPRSLEYIKEILSISSEDNALFETFFTQEEPARYEPYTGDKIRMRYFGHACILVETKDISILVDPLISYYGYHSDVDHFSDLHLPDVIDYVLITHNHQDHILFETLLPLRHKIKHIIVPHTNSGKLEDPDLKLMFNNIGFNNVIAIDEMETIRFSDAVITGIPFTGEHSDMNIITKSCYFVQIGQFRLVFLADSRILEPSLYKHIQQVTGDPDVMFLGMECDGAPLSWLYGPLLTKKLSREQDNSRRLSGSDCDKGMSLVNIFNPKEVYVYAMGQEPWVEFISSIKYTDESNPIIQSNHLIRLCEEKGIVAERLFGEKELLYDKQLTPVEA